MEDALLGIGEGKAADRQATTMQFTVGFKVGEKTDHTVVDVEDDLIAASKVKMQRPNAEIMYVRRANRGERGTPASPPALTRRRDTRERRGTFAGGVGSLQQGENTKRTRWVFRSA